MAMRPWAMHTLCVESLERVSLQLHSNLRWRSYVPATPEGRPCHECESCRKVLNYSHPDFHVIMPLSLQKEHRAGDGKLSAEGWKFLSDSVRERIAEPLLSP